MSQEGGPTARVATFIAETAFGSIPEAATRVAKDAVLDFVGVTVGGAGEPAVRLLCDRIRETGGSGEATVIGSDLRTTAELAAWANGCASHALDYDDVTSEAAGYNFHPSVPLLPALLALGEKCGASGSDVLAAYVVGLEVQFRVGAAVGRHLTPRGWHPTPVIGTLGAAAASANLLGLDAARAEMALGLAGSLAGGLLHNFGTMTKPLHAGNAARNGVTAALLAARGFTAGPGVLDAEQGFCGMFGEAKGVRPHADDLGRVWHVLSPGLSLKPYPCCRSTHGSIDAALEVRPFLTGDFGGVARIVCKVSPQQTKLARFHRPETAYEGKFSIPYCVAVALLRGRVLLEDFTAERLASPEARSLLSKVEFLHPDEYARNPATLAAGIVVRVRDGTERSASVTVPRGDAENPMTREELRLKFADCAGRALTRPAIERTLEILDHLESLPEIGTLLEMIR